jgi:hypothetical protein
MDSNGRTIWIADAHRDDGKPFVVRVDEKLTPFLELDLRMGSEPLRLQNQIQIAELMPKIAALNCFLVNRANLRCWQKCAE